MGHHGHGDGDRHHHLPGAVIPNAAVAAMMTIIIIVGADDVVTGMAVPIVIIVGMPMVMAMMVLEALVPLRRFCPFFPTFAYLNYVKIVVS